MKKVIHYTWMIYTVLIYIVIHFNIALSVKDTCNDALHLGWNGLSYKLSIWFFLFFAFFFFFFIKSPLVSFYSFLNTLCDSVFTDGGGRKWLWHIYKTMSLVQIRKKVTANNLILQIKKKSSF